MKTETEVIVLSTNDALTTNLEKENITDVVIADLKTKYSNLKISGLEDKEGYKQVDKARLDVKQKRIIAEKICNVFVSEAHAIHKSRTAKRTEIVSQFTDIEDGLQKKLDVIDNELAKLKQIEDDKKKATTAKRISDLQAVNYSGDLMVIEFLSDEQYAAKLTEATEAKRVADEKIAEEKRLAQVEAEKIEAQRIENEKESQRLAKIKAEQEAESLRLENEQKEKIRLIEEREAKIKAEEDRIKREKIEAEQKVIREAELEKAKKEAAEKTLKDAEEKRIADEKANEERLKNEEREKLRLESLKSEKEKMNTWINSLDYGYPDSLKERSEECGVMINEIQKKFIAFKTWAQTQIESLK